MKRFLLVIVSLLLISSISTRVYASDNENKDVDINEWTFIMLTGRSDQDNNVVVSKYYKVKDKNQIAFCIEPNILFKPINSNYTKKTNDNEFIYEVAKAYNQIGKNDNNYYIAAQLLIWNEITNVDYTFDGNNYSSFKEELLNIICHDETKTLLSTKQKIYESYVGQISTIKDDYTDYEASGEGIKIISNDENGIRYIIEDKDPEYKYIELFPIDSDDKHSYIYESETSQDLYTFEGEYSNLKPLKLNLLTLSKPDFFSLNYSKKDELGNNIKDAEFSIYEINDINPNFELYFININTNINLVDMLIENKEDYDNLSIKVSERYEKYLNGIFINTNEIGYFPINIYEDNELIKTAKIYVTNDINQNGGTYKKIQTRIISSVLSKDQDINKIENLNTNSSYYFCESEPAKGYEYSNDPCVLINGNDYDGNTVEFTNKSRKYTLKLMKQSDSSILLNNAVFKISYIENEKEVEKIYATGLINIERENNYKYLIYKNVLSDNAIIKKFEENYISFQEAPGDYIYYQSNNTDINNELFVNRIKVINGGFEINDLPYSSTLRIEELQAPKGYVITEPVYYITPDIKYSEITFTNYRVNSMDIIPGIKYKIPKTCVN